MVPPTAPRPCDVLVSTRPTASLTWSGASATKAVPASAAWAALTGSVLRDPGIDLEEGQYVFALADELPVDESHSGPPSPTGIVGTLPTSSAPSTTGGSPTDALGDPEARRGVTNVDIAQDPQYGSLRIP